MTLSELIQEVYTITNRPDRVDETLSAIKSATLKAHQCDFFWKDIFETGIDFLVYDYIQSFEYRTLIPNWRSNKYIRPYDAINSVPGKPFTLITPEQILDRYDVQKTEVYYAAGAEITLKSSAQYRYFLYGCYLNPDVTVAGYNSWVAMDHPYAIIFDAAATVFKAIGKDEEAAAYRTMVPEQIAMVKASNIVGEGF